MARYPLPDEYMTPAELAKRMGLGVQQMTNELRRDSKREIKQYPFAVSIYNEDTRTWQYRIHKGRHELWEQGKLMDSGQMAALVAQKVIEHLQGDAAMRYQR